MGASGGCAALQRRKSRSLSGAADFIFAQGVEEGPPAVLVSDVKLRAAGFGEVMDTEETFRYWLTNLIERRILPPARVETAV